MASLTDPIDLKLTATGDLAIGTDLIFTTGIDAVAQGIRIRVLTFRGEWRLNLDSGVPYYQDILGQAFDQARAQSAVRAAILGTPNVNSILSLSVSMDESTRTLVVSWTADTVFGVTEDSVEI